MKLIEIDWGKGQQAKKNEALPHPSSLGQIIRNTYLEDELDEKYTAATFLSTLFEKQSDLFDLTDESLEFDKLKTGRRKEILESDLPNNLERNNPDFSDPSFRVLISGLKKDYDQSTLLMNKLLLDPTDELDEAKLYTRYENAIKLYAWPQIKELLISPDARNRRLIELIKLYFTNDDHAKMEAIVTNISKVETEYETRNVLKRHVLNQSMLDFTAVASPELIFSKRPSNHENYSNFPLKQKQYKHTHFVNGDAVKIRQDRQVNDNIERILYDKNRFKSLIGITAPNINELKNKADNQIDFSREEHLWLAEMILQELLNPSDDLERQLRKNFLRESPAQIIQKIIDNYPERYEKLLTAAKDRSSVLIDQVANINIVDNNKQFAKRFLRRTFFALGLISFASIPWLAQSLIHGDENPYLAPGLVASFLALYLMTARDPFHLSPKIIQQNSDPSLLPSYKAPSLKFPKLHRPNLKRITKYYEEHFKRNSIFYGESINGTWIKSQSELPENIKLEFPRRISQLPHNLARREDFDQKLGDELTQLPADLPEDFRTLSLRLGIRDKGIIETIEAIIRNIPANPKAKAEKIDQALKAPWAFQKEIIKYALGDHDRKPDFPITPELINELIVLSLRSAGYPSVILLNRVQGQFPLVFAKGTDGRIAAYPIYGMTRRFENSRNNYQTHMNGMALATALGALLTSGLVMATAGKKVRFPFRTNNTENFDPSTLKEGEDFNWLDFGNSDASSDKYVPWHFDRNLKTQYIRTNTYNAFNEGWPSFEHDYPEKQHYIELVKSNQPTELIATRDYNSTITNIDSDILPVPEGYFPKTAVLNNSAGIETQATILTDGDGQAIYRAKGFQCPSICGIKIEYAYNPEAYRMLFQTAKGNYPEESSLLVRRIPKIKNLDIDVLAKMNETDRLKFLMDFQMSHLFYKDTTALGKRIFKALHDGVPIAEAVYKNRAAECEAGNIAAGQILEAAGSDVRFPLGYLVDGKGQLGRHAWLEVWQNHHWITADFTPSAIQDPVPWSTILALTLISGPLLAFSYYRAKAIEEKSLRLSDKTKKLAAEFDRNGQGAGVHSLLEWALYSNDEVFNPAHVFNSNDDKKVTEKEIISAAQMAFYTPSAWGRVDQLASSKDLTKKHRKFFREI